MAGFTMKDRTYALTPTGISECQRMRNAYVNEGCKKLFNSLRAKRKAYWNGVIMVTSYIRWYARFMT